jgi:hypothetical protein
VSSLLDHITAIAAGGVVLLAILTLQMRDRVAAVETTVSDVAQAQAASIADALAQEFDNTLSKPMTVAALGVDQYRCRLVRDSTNERTTEVEIPAYIRTVQGGAARAATVRYTLVAAERTVAVGTQTHPVYQLKRQVDTGSGYGAASTVADGIVDFDVKFRGRASVTFVGPPPLRFSQIAFQVVVAVTPPRALPGRVRRQQTNSARAVFAVRPPNLTTDA